MEVEVMYGTVHGVLVKWRQEGRVERTGPHRLERFGTSVCARHLERDRGGLDDSSRTI